MNNNVEVINLKLKVEMSEANKQDTTIVESTNNFKRITLGISVQTRPDQSSQHHRTA